MICVTGSGGTVGSELVEQLEAANAPFRVAHFSSEKAESARARGLEAVTIDYSQPETLGAAFQGCDKLFLLGPPVLSQTQFELNAVNAAQAADVRQIVKLSVLGAADEAYSLAKVHRPVEKAIESSGLAWTFLRPNSFMQNAETYMREAIIHESALFSASGDAKISHVDVRDIAAVAVQALIKPDHDGKAYTLTGPEAFTNDELAKELSQVLGHTINHVNLPPADMKQGMLAQGMHDELADRMLDLERYFREGGANLITDDIKQVTKRGPRRLADYLREAAARGVWTSGGE